MIYISVRAQGVVLRRGPILCAVSKNIIKMFEKAYSMCYSKLIMGK